MSNESAQNRGNILRLSHKSMQIVEFTGTGRILRRVFLVGRLEADFLVTGRLNVV